MGDPQQDPPEAGLDLQQRLTEAQNLLVAGLPVEAFVATVRLTDAYPDYRIPEVDAASQLAEGIVETASPVTLASIEASLPNLWSSVQSAYAKERIARFYELRAAADEEGTPAWRDYVQKLADAHWQIIVEDPEDIVAYFKINTFLKSARALGGEDEAYERIKTHIDTLEPCAASFGGWLALAEKARERSAVGEVELYYQNMLNVAERGGLDSFLNDPDAPPTTKAARLYHIGYGYYSTHQLERALAQFQYVMDNFTDPPERAQWVHNVPVLFSGLLSARITAQLNVNDPYEGILAYHDFVQRNPDTAVAAQAMLEMGGLYLLHGDYRQAADVYRQVIQSHPGTEGASGAEAELEYVLNNLYGSVEVVATAEEVQPTCGSGAVRWHCGNTWP